MELLKVSVLFAATAVAEIVGCYLPWLVIKQGKSAWLLIPSDRCRRDLAGCDPPLLPY